MPNKKSWKENIPVGWKYHMVYNQRGEGSAVFRGPNGEYKRIGPSYSLGWDSKTEAFGEAALRHLFKLFPELRNKRYDIESSTMTSR